MLIPIIEDSRYRLRVTDLPPSRMRHWRIKAVSTPRFRKKTIPGVQGRKEKRRDGYRVLSNPLIWR